MCNEESKEIYVLTKIHLYENLQTKSWAALPPNPDLLVEKLKCTQLQCSVWLNALEATLLPLDVDFYEWKVRGDNNLVPKWFSKSTATINGK